MKFFIVVEITNVTWLSWRNLWEAARWQLPIIGAHSKPIFLKFIFLPFLFFFTFIFCNYFKCQKLIFYITFFTEYFGFNLSSKSISLFFLFSFLFLHFPNPLLWNKHLQFPLSKLFPLIFKALYESNELTDTLRPQLTVLIQVEITEMISKNLIFILVFLMHILMWAFMILLYSHTLLRTAIEAFWKDHILVELYELPTTPNSINSLFCLMPSISW